MPYQEGDKVRVLLTTDSSFSGREGELFNVIGNNPEYPYLVRFEPGEHGWSAFAYNEIELVN